MTHTLVDWSATGRPALITEAGIGVTYAQLRAQVLANAKLLQKQQLVFLFCSNDVPTIAFYLGCLEAGAVPLLLDRSLSSESLTRLLAVYKPKYLFLPHSRPNVSGALEVVWSTAGYDFVINKAAEGPTLHPDLYLLLATSGSTGSPKLVRLSQSNVVSNARAIVEYLGIKNCERSITSLPFNYSFGMSVVNSHLHAGASIVLTNRSLLDPLFWKQLKSHEVTSLAGVPFSYEVLLKLRVDRMELPSLKTFIQAGGKMAATLMDRISQVSQAKGIRFFVMYGQTEASPRMAYLDPDYLRDKLGSIGKAVPGGRLWIEDDHGRMVDQPDRIGELVYSGPNVALGYAERVEDLCRGDDWHGVLRTGDLARYDSDGFFFIEGRKNRFLKIFGVRLSLDAVEAWFSERGIVAAAHGHDDCLQVTIEGGGDRAKPKEVEALCNAMRLHHSAVSISVLPKLPRLGSGKVDYRCLNTKL